MNNTIIFILSSVVLFLTACSSHHIYVNPQYKNQQIDDALLFIPQSINANIVKREEVLSEVDVHYSKNDYARIFSNALINNLKSYSKFKKVEFVKLPTAPITKAIEFSVEDDRLIEIDIPEKLLSIENTNPVFLLLLDSLKISFYKKLLEDSKPKKTFTVSGNTTEEALLYSYKTAGYYISVETNFTLYDNRRNAIVTHGHYAAEELYKQNKTIKKIVNTAVQNLVNSILQHSPFEK